MRHEFLHQLPVRGGIHGLADDTLGGENRQVGDLTAQFGLAWATACCVFFSACARMSRARSCACCSICARSCSPA